MSRLRKASARLGVTTPQMRRPHDTLSAARADAPGIRANNLQHRKLTTLATHDHAIHAYTCNHEGKRSRILPTQAESCNRRNGRLQIPRKADETSVKPTTLAMRTPAEFCGKQSSRQRRPSILSTRLDSFNSPRYRRKQQCRHHTTEDTEKGTCAACAADSCRRTNQAIQQDHRTA